MESLVHLRAAAAPACCVSMNNRVYCTICIRTLESGNCTSRGGLGQMSLVNWLPNVSTQSRVFISGNEIQGMVTYIPVGGGEKWAGKMGGKLKVWVVTWVMGGAVNK